MSSSYDLSVDLTAVCRCCMNENPALRTIFCNQIIDGAITQFPDVFECVTGFKVRLDDGLPQKLCPICRQTLIDSYVLQQKYKTNRLLLLDILKLSLNDAVAVDTKPPTNVRSSLNQSNDARRRGQRKNASKPLDDGSLLDAEDHPHIQIEEHFIENTSGDDPLLEFFGDSLQQRRPNVIEAATSTPSIRQRRPNTKRNYAAMAGVEKGGSDDDDDDDGDDGDYKDHIAGHSSASTGIKKEKSGEISKLTSAVQMQSGTIELLNTELRKLKDAMRGNQQIEADATPMFESAEHLPIGSYQALLEYDSSLNKVDFKNYIMSIGGNDYARLIANAINEIFSPELQIATTWHGIRNNAGDGWLKPPMKVTRFPKLMAEVCITKWPHLDMDTCIKRFQSYYGQALDRKRKREKRQQNFKV